MQIKETKPVDLGIVKDRTSNFTNFLYATAHEIVPGNILWAYINNTKMFEKVKITGIIPDMGVKVILVSRDRTKADTLVVPSTNLYVKLD